MDIMLSETSCSVRVNGHNISFKNNVPSLCNGHKRLMLNFVYFGKMADYGFS